MFYNVTKRHNSNHSVVIINYGEFSNILADDRIRSETTRKSESGSIKNNGEGVVLLPTGEKKTEKVCVNRTSGQ